ncbi:hypothetical protein BpHYR1_041210 [Brachionus plicatilis]|uniref:Uncharacterized protein n=1 Tax=Brachionus plicatilis TaxID=10195 RepID=A0A3M7T5Q2_BRAPC|nr:hypothetical protein BpHYR1_041210 [Brachionus plicatilis]
MWVLGLMWMLGLML